MKRGRPEGTKMINGQLCWPTGEPVRVESLIGPRLPKMVKRIKDLAKSREGTGSPTPSTCDACLAVMQLIQNELHEIHRIVGKPEAKLKPGSVVFP